MKRIIFVLFISHIGSCLMAQAVYLKAGSGFHFPVEKIYDFNVGSSVSYDGKYRIDGALGLEVSELFSVELHATFLPSLRNSFDLKNEGGRFPAPDKIYYAGNGIQLAPIVRLNFCNDPILLYSRAGLVMGKFNSEYSNSNGEKSIYNGDWGIGFAFGLGLEYPINNILFVYSEANIVSINSKGNRISNELSTFTSQVDYVIPYSSYGLNIGIRWKVFK